MQKLKEKYKNAFKTQGLFVPIVFSSIILFASLVLNYFAEIYATESASNSVTDIILSNTRAFDVDGMFIYGGLCLVILIGIVCTFHPKKIPFTLKSISLFAVIRSVFISLTHIGPFSTSTFTASKNIINSFSMGSDLFFSGHTGLPFLMALLFWKNKKLRYLFLVLSGFFGVIVLLGHYHYTIDVLSAFFITYTIYHIAKYLFKKDRALFDSEI